MISVATMGIIGTGAGCLGSIVTAISLNNVLWELNYARSCLETTVIALVHNSSNLPVYTGLDKRHERAICRSKTAAFVGIALLALGFLLQSYSIWKAIPEPAPLAITENLQ